MRSTIDALSTSQLRELEDALSRERLRLERFTAPEAVVDAIVHDREVAMGGMPLAGAADEPFAPTPRQADARLQAVDDAIARIRNGTYGTCARCGSAIPFGRLIVLPES
ncbi:MAG TPA: TraR/DksA C4-type zinc finger protein, partial [Gemmatimonadaceae bacterium]|nr:TraR/DksA C4-type zinc finger protein [Gemmatimonadaceae bacterium]